MSANGGARGEGPPRRLAVLTGSMLLLESSLYSVMAPVLPHYAHLLGLSKSASGVLVASYAAGLLAGAGFGPLLAARVSIKGAAAIGVGLFGAASVGFGFAQSLALLDALRVLQGIGGGLMWLAGLTWVVSVVAPERHGTAIGATFSVAIIGTLFGPLLGTLALAVGIDVVFAAIGLLSAVLVGFVLATAGPPVSREGAGALGLLMRTPAARVPALLIVLVASAVGAMNTLLPLLLDSLGVGHLGIGAVFLGGAVMAAIASPFVGRAVDRGDRWALVRLGLLASLIATATLAPVRGEIALGVLAAVTLAIWPMVSVPLSTIISGDAEAEGIPSVAAMSWLTFAWAAGELLGAPAGSLIAQVGSFTASFSILAAVSALALIAISPIARPAIARRRG